MYTPISRRKFLTGSGKAILGAGLAGTLLSGCGDDGAEGGGPIELSYWSEIEGAEAQQYYRKNVARPFAKANDLKFDVRFVSDVDREVRTALQGGAGPDLVPTLGPSFALEYVEANLFRGLNKYVEQFGWKDRILGWALDLGRSNGELYSVPTRFETMLLYYNKSLFEDKGWEPPTNREELEAVAEEAKGQGIIPFAAGNEEYRTSTEWFVTVFWNHYAGPEALYQALTGEIPWTDPIFVDAIDLLNQYFQKGWFGGNIQQFFTTAPNEWYAQLGSGEAAMDMDGFWVASTIGDFFGQDAGNDNEWGWKPLPSLRSGVPQSIYELAIGATLSINSRSEYPDEAASYMDWYFSDPKRIAKRMAEVPAWFNIAAPVNEDDFPSNMDSRIKQIIAELNNATSKGNFGYATWTFWPPKTDQFIIEKLENVLTGDMTPVEYCEGVNKLFQQEFEDGKVPPAIEPGNA